METLNNEYDEWQYVAAIALAKTYSEEEADYENIPVKECNTEYKK
ncbi:hypothetical protein BH11BAC7_BH11BAC7_17560 [soil metagenome]